MAAAAPAPSRAAFLARIALFAGAGLAQAVSIAAPWNGRPLWWLQLLSLAVLVWQLDDLRADTRSKRWRSAALHGWLDRAHRGRESLLRVGEVGLGENHDGMHPDLSRQHQIALDPADTEILIARCDDEQRVDIRGDHLLLARIGGRAPLEQIHPAQNTHGLKGDGIDDQPVPDSRMVVGGCGAGDIGRDKALETRASHRDLAAVDGHHPDRKAMQRFLLIDLLAEPGSPAELLEGFIRRCHNAKRSFP